MVQDLSVEEVIKNFLSGEMSTELIGSLCALSSKSFSADLKSGERRKTLATQSSLPVAIMELSLDNLQQFTPGSSFLKSAWNSTNLINFLHYYHSNC